MQRFRPRILTHASTMVLVLAGALGSLGAPGEAQAVAVDAGCGPQTGLPQSSQVLGVTEGPTGGGLFTYNFKLCNTSSEIYGDLIRDWEIPFNTQAGITGIFDAPGWLHSTETIGVPNPNTGWDGTAEWQTPGDPMYNLFPSFRTHTQVLHWYTSECFQSGETPAEFTCNGGSPISPGNSTETFGFTSPLGPIDGPYQASWMVLPPRSGDPPLPDEPLTGLGSAFLQAPQQVPEPGGLAIFALGLGALMAARARRRQENET